MKKKYASLRFVSFCSFFAGVKCEICIPNLHLLSKIEKQENIM